MDGDRFDNAVRAWMKVGSRRRMLGGLLAAAAGLRLGWDAVLAQDETTAAGNGGTADAGANGGAVGTGDVNSGENTGNEVGVGDSVGEVDVDGGAAANATDIDVEADGGAAIADASGGDENFGLIRLTCSPGAPSDPDSDPGTGPLPTFSPEPPFVPDPSLPSIPSIPDPDPDPDPEPGPDPEPEIEPEPDPPPCTCPCDSGYAACPGAGKFADLVKCCPVTPGTPHPCGQADSGQPCCGGQPRACAPVDPVCIA